MKASKASKYPDRLYLCDAWKSLPERTAPRGANKRTSASNFARKGAPLRTVKKKSDIIIIPVDQTLPHRGRGPRWG